VPIKHVATAQIKSVNAFACKFRRLTLQDVAVEVGIYAEPCFEVLTKILVMWRISTKFISQLLTIE
jgi:hypothetical protein